jgi:hypothetical protein
MPQLSQQSQRRRAVDPNMLVLAAVWFTLAAIFISLAAHAGTVCTRLGGGPFCRVNFMYISALLALIFFSASAFALTQSGLRSRLARGLVPRSSPPCCRRATEALPEPIADERSRLLATARLDAVCGAIAEVKTIPTRVRRSRRNRKSPVMIPLAGLPFRCDIFTIPLRMNGRKNYKGLCVTTDYRLLALARLENRR